MDTKQKIINTVKEKFALLGPDGISMRNIAADLELTQSSIYNHFVNKEDMLDEIFEITRKSLGEKRKELPQVQNLEDMLQQRISFQLDNAIDVIYILKYFMYNRSRFKKNHQGYIPINAYKHIKEVLDVGIKDGFFENENIDMQSKVITHSINGFVLEYYPDIPQGSEKKQIVKDISSFIYRGIKKKGGVNNG